MTGTGIFDDLLDARVLRGRGQLSIVDTAFSLLTRGRSLSPLGRALRAGGTAVAETIVQEVWRAEFGEDATQPSLAAGPRRPALLIRTMACVAQTEAVLDASALEHLDTTLPQLDLPADARARLAALLADPGAPADIVRDVDHPGEALLLHVVARSVRAPFF